MNAAELAEEGFCLQPYGSTIICLLHLFLIILYFHSCLLLLASSASLMYSLQARRSLSVHSSPYKCVPASLVKRLYGEQPSVVWLLLCGNSSVLGFRPRSLLRNASELLSYFKQEFSVRRNGMFGPPRG